MKSSSRLMLQLVFILCVGVTLRADESQYLLTPQSSIDQTESTLHPDLRNTQPKAAVLPVGPRKSQEHPLRTVVSSLAIVLGAFLLAAAILRKQGKSQTQTRAVPTAMHGDLMNNVGELQVSPEVKLNLVRIGSRLLVLHLSDDGVQTVAEISDEAEVQQLLNRSNSAAAAAATDGLRDPRPTFTSFDEFDSHPQVGDLLRSVEGKVREFA